MTLKDVLQFIQEHDLAVLATSGPDNTPQAAILEFTALDDATILIDTLKTSRKYHNMKSNSKVALVIGWENNRTVQITATATELAGQDLVRAEEQHVHNNEYARKWEEYDRVAYFALKPSTIHYTDAGQSPWTIEDFEL